MMEVVPRTAKDMESEESATLVRLENSRFFNVVLYGQWTPGSRGYDAYYDPEVPWLDKRVRQAMNLAIDRTAIAQAIFEGYGAPVGVSPGYPWSDELEPYPYDPDRARELLEEAGYPDGFSVEMWWTTVIAQGAEMGEVLQAV